MPYTFDRDPEPDEELGPDYHVSDCPFTTGEYLRVYETGAD